ncbi:MAG: hypothetical protein K9G41_07230 [Flavobacteriales bacterium]|nr:hypothetical protein [Flavobacteriales bacterium]
MLPQICNQTSATILRALAPHTEVKDGGICQPDAYFATIHQLISSVLGIAVAHNLNRDLSQNKTLNKTFEWIDNELFTSSIFTHNFNLLSSSKKEVLEAFFDWFTTQDFDSVPLSDLYELMLLLEFPVKDNAITEDTENLNSIGSFYTPHALADTFVALTIDHYIFQNTGLKSFSVLEKSDADLQLAKELIKQSTFADYSCGTGSFFLAILRYFERYLHFSKEELKQLVLNFYAIEADALSLEIAKIQVLEAVDDLNLYPELSTRFINGNPLIAPDDEVESFAYSSDFYYHNGLALNPNSIQKCDVIIGNPPWVSVGFDLHYYLHLLYPQLAELENEHELDAALEVLENSHPALYNWLLLHDEAVDVAMENIYNDHRFNHSCMGGLQTNVLFTELCNALCTERGTVGLVLKGATLSDSVNKRLWHYLLANMRVSARFDFINCNKIFNIDNTEEFSLLLLSNHEGSDYKHLTGLTHLSEID